MWPLLLAMHVCVLLWPLTTLAMAFGLYGQIKDMIDAKRIVPINAVMVVYYVVFLRFFLKVACRKEILPALWVQLLDRNLKCAIPGQMLEVVKVSDTTSDVILNPDWVTMKGEKSWLRIMAGNIRRSIDMTMLAALSDEQYGSQGDDIDNPQYFLSGQPGASIDGMTEIWTCHSTVPSFPALYSWCESLPILRLHIPLQADETVVGHVLLLKTSQRVESHDISTMRNPCAALVPSWMGNDKVVARRGYWAKFLFGNFRAGKPDAFVFKEQMIQRTGLHVAHTFRIVARSNTADATLA